MLGIGVSRRTKYQIRSRLGIKDASTSNSQHQSIFFKLPEEIRRQIYQLVFADYATIVHILAGSEHNRPNRSLLHIPCIISPDYDPSRHPMLLYRWCPGHWGIFHYPCATLAKEKYVPDKRKDQMGRGTVRNIKILASRPDIISSPHMPFDVRSLQIPIFTTAYNIADHRPS